MKTSFLILFSCITTVIHVHGTGLKYSGAKGTQLNRPGNDPLRYTTHSNLPHLPYVGGYIGTHGTYRFLTVSEQTATLIGDGKHGLWRVQENGFIREYRKKGKQGLPKDLDPNSPSTLLNQRYSDIIKNNYVAHEPSAGFSHYRYPDQKVSDGSDGIKDVQEYIDLTIYHPKYGGRYEQHEVIDLAHFYCTMSQGNYPYMEKAWKFLRAQPKANIIGPLARRAGFDIKEHFLNVVRLNLFEDGNVWANVGVGDPNKDKKFKDINDFKTHLQSVNFQDLDLSQVNYEIYLIERPFFNDPYLFITLIMEDKKNPSVNTYIRPHGDYWEEVKKRFNTTLLNHTPPHYPEYPIKDYPTKGSTSTQTAKGLPVYALHNPNRRAFKLTGGACPERGGDYATYPFGNPGAGWPTNYEEVGPICDAVLIDVKVWANMDKQWDDDHMFLANAAFDKTKMEYIADANIYGKYTDPYLANQVNPHMIDLTANGKQVPPPPAGANSPAPISFSLEFARLGKHLDFNNVSAIHEVEVVLPNGGGSSSGNNTIQCPNSKEVEDDHDIIIALLITITVLVAFMFLACVFYILARSTTCVWEKDDVREAREVGVDNQGASKR